MTARIDNGATLTDLAADLNVTPERIKQVLAAHKIPAPKPDPRPRTAILSREARTDRLATILDMRLNQGRTLDEIGTAFGLSRQRVDQILITAGHPDHAQQARAARRTAESERATATKNTLVRLLTEDPTRTSGDLAAAADIPASSVAGTLGDQSWLLTDMTPTVSPHTAESALDALQTAAEVTAGETLTAAAYNDWRKKQRPTAPTAASIARQFGTWRHATDLIGVPAGKHGRQPAPPIAREDAIASIVTFLRHARENGLRGTANQYRTWSVTNDAPPLIRITGAGTWPELRIEAVRRVLAS
jgi:hypothetical protein